MRGKIFLLFCMILVCRIDVALAGGIEPVLVPPSGPITAGEEAVFIVYFHNTAETSTRLELKEQLACRLLTNSGPLDLAAHAVKRIDSPFLSMAANGFVKKRYALLLPRTITGVVTLQLTEYNEVTAMFAVRPATAVAAAPPEPPTSAAPSTPTERNDEEPEFQTLEQLFTLYQPYLGNISAYEPIYFLAGTSLEKSKFQLSAKYRIFDPNGTLARKYQWLSGLHLAYTQTAFWDLKAASKPFGDTSYKPEVFFLSSNLAAEESTWNRVFLQAGFQHESNGRGGAASRRTNFLYLEPILVLFKRESLLGLQIAPRLWVYVANEDENNPDLADYRGFFDLKIKAGRADRLVLGSHFRYAQKGGSLQLDLSYPLHRVLGGNLDVYLHAQYANGLAENLLNYRQRTEAFRLGISIVR